MRLILLSLLSSLWPLLWARRAALPALLSLSMVMFTFVVVFMQGLAEYIMDAGEGDKQTVDSVRVWFSSFWESFLTLFKVITGGINWQDVHNPLESASFWYGNLFVLYVAIMVFGVLNVITGIFVECAVTKARADTDLSLQEEVDREKSMMMQLIQLFRVMDANMSGTISHDEWEAFTRQPNAKAILTLMDLDIHKTHQIFALIDADGSNEVDLEEFVMGCMKLQGGAKTVDLEAMLQNNKVLVRKNLHHLHNLSRHFKKQLDVRLKTTDTEVRRLHEVTESMALLLREHGFLTTARDSNGLLAPPCRDDRRRPTAAPRPGQPGARPVASEPVPPAAERL
ncbi:unnamed protein product [Prorocentrum cordatum]|uniref:EF-hand domain-containing protein n=1 Tax=Prorocentrum cordatum TaxID=2364126 RepID=A0ABN9R9W5_9DINO|nr:unnamed protein product [Polarella glacialis]